MNKERQKLFAAAIFFLVTLGLVGLLAKYTPFLEILELKNYDFMMAVLRGPLEPPGDIIVVAIDEDSIAEFSQHFAYPWPRSVHASLIQQLNRAGARVIIFDILYDLESYPEQDEALTAAIRSSRVPVILAGAVSAVVDPRFSSIQHVLPLDPFIEAGGHIGYATLHPDRDDSLRQARLFVGGEPGLAVQALDQTGVKPDFSRMPVAGREGDDPEILVNFAGGARRIPTVSYYQALDFENSLPRDVFRDKYVLIGYSLAITDISQGPVADHYPTPFDLLGEATSMSGVEIHANALNTLLRGIYISGTSPAGMWLGLVVLGVLVSLVVLRVETFRWKILFSVGILFMYLLAAAVLFVAARQWILVIQPVTVIFMLFGLNTLYQYRQTEKERAQIRRALSGYVSRQVMNEIMKDPDRLELGGVQVEATVLFSDIQGFSKISEAITPRELATLLNNYFTRMGDAIMQREGMINKFIGDAIMAVWNAPLPNREHAALACEAALEMKRIVAEMAPLKTRIGINTGSMVAGNLGHRERMEYTVIGDAVNLASRLEGANKTYRTTVLISEFTEQRVRGAVLLRRVDRIRVVGKENPVNIFEVLCRNDDPGRSEQQALVDSFQQILEAYDAREWFRAKLLLERHLQEFPEDTVAQTYLMRCRQYIEAPPPEAWDGVFTLEMK